MTIPQTIAARMLAELENEIKTTRRMIERIPADKLAWKPHEKSMALGRLAGHIAEMIGWIPLAVESDGIDFASYPYKPKDYSDAGEILADLDAAVARANEALGAAAEEKMAEGWTMRNGEKVYMTIPKAVVVRTWVMNHVYHHRGQLSVYMRLLDIPVPSIYGPSADEAP